MTLQSPFVGKVPANRSHIPLIVPWIRRSLLGASLVAGVAGLGFGPVMAYAAADRPIGQPATIEGQIAVTRTAIQAELTRQAELTNRQAVLDKQIAALVARTPASGAAEKQPKAQAPAKPASQRVVAAEKNAAPVENTTALPGGTSSEPQRTGPASKPTKPKSDSSATEPSTSSFSLDGLEPPALPLLGGTVSVAVLLGGLMWLHRRPPRVKLPEDRYSSTEELKARLASLRENFDQDCEPYTDSETSVDNVVPINRAMAGKLAEEAVAAFSRNDLGQAEALISKAIRIDDSQAEYQELLACVLDATGRGSEARLLRGELRRQANGIGG